MTFWVCVWFAISLFKNSLFHSLLKWTTKTKKSIKIVYSLLHLVPMKKGFLLKSERMATLFSNKTESNRKMMLINGDVSKFIVLNTLKWKKKNKTNELRLYLWFCCFFFKSVFAFGYILLPHLINYNLQSK